MIQITPISAFDDNYIWCIHNENLAYVVDPGDHKPVAAYLQQHQLALAGILITHHHADHIGGVKHLIALQAQQGKPALEIIGPNTARFPFLTKSVSEGDSFQLNALGISLTAMEVPGHTRDHIAYMGDIGLFCGDTMFSAGCGRLFEGNAEQMQTNFSRFKTLPSATKVYCTHEYTLSNLEFAVAVWPQNSEIVEYQRKAQEQRAKNQPTLPSDIALELKINPFMNTDDADIKNNVEQHFGSAYASPIEVFAALRSWKDNF